MRPWMVTGELAKYLPGYWQRILASPLFHFDLDCELYVPIWTSRYWDSKYRWLRGRFYSFCKHTLHIYWVREEGGFWVDGDWVLPAEWHRLNNLRLVRIQSIEAKRKAERDFVQSLRPQSGYMEWMGYSGDQN